MVTWRPAYCSFLTFRQFHYALELFKPVVEGLLDSVEPKMTAHDKYNGWLQRRLSHSVFVGCQSWYRAGSKGKVHSIFPGPLSVFWLWTRKPEWKDYNVDGVRKAAWERKRRNAKVVQVAALVVAAAMGLALWSEPTLVGVVAELARAHVVRCLFGLHATAPILTASVQDRATQSVRV
jgi:hypothetical protein